LGVVESRIATRFPRGFPAFLTEPEEPSFKVVALRCAEVSIFVTSDENWPRFMRASRRDRDIAVFDALPVLVAVKPARTMLAYGGLCLAKRLARDGFQPKVFVAKPGSERRRAWTVFQS